MTVGQQPHMQFLLQCLPSTHNRDFVRLSFTKAQLFLTAEKMLQQKLLISVNCPEFVFKAVNNPTAIPIRSNR